MAPAPTGRLHVGTARTTLYNWLFARHHGGTFVLRIEDTDQSRSTQENVCQILEAIRWLGLDWDEGPEVDGPYGPYFQSQRVAHYREAVDRLLEQGDGQAIAPRYDRRCRELSRTEREKREAEGRPKAIRFAVPDEGATGWDDLVRGRVEFQSSELDDFVIMKSDGFPSYNFACVVDDATMAMTHVLRGEDLNSGTPRQLHLYRALGLEAPQFGHLPMILAPDRSKLSKRHGATSITEYHDKGYLPEAVVNFIALLGWSPGDDRELMSREEMIEAFSIEGIGKSGAVFDADKFAWMNGVYLRQMSAEEYVARARPFLEAHLGPLVESFSDDYVASAVLLEQERAKTLAELPELTEFFFRDPKEYEDKGERKWFRQEGAAELLAAVRDALQGLDRFDEASIESAVRAVAERLDTKAGPVIHTTRLATTGRTKGPGLFELLAVLGKERVLPRLRRAEKHVRGLA
jgi:glutamyl-tRNA synthetase